MTRNRRQWLPQAVRCFRSQTYPNKELLIVADGENIRDVVPDDPNIRLVEIESGHTIGEKRNFGCERAAREFIAHWDDDDFSAPGRLADQLSRLQASGKAVIRYSPMYFARTRPGRPVPCSLSPVPSLEWWIFQGSGIAVIGSSLFYSKSWWERHPFPARQVGEDSDFGMEAARAGQLVTAEAGLLMAATIHPANSSPRNLSGYTKVPDFPGVHGLEFPQ